MNIITKRGKEASQLSSEQTMAIGIAIVGVDNFGRDRNKTHSMTELCSVRMCYELMTSILRAPTCYQSLF